ncbi:hypothetical protein E2I00_001319, partial [Balaenoptera physalus]
LRGEVPSGIGSLQGSSYNFSRRKAVLQVRVSHWSSQHHWGIIKHLGTSVSAAKMNCVTKGNYKKSLNPNGIKCPACFDVDDISCEPVLLTRTGAETKCLNVIGQVLLTCTGAETKCLNVIGQVFAMGCATETACNLKNISLLSNIKLHTYCVESNGRPQVTSITSSILTGLFLLKVLL